MPTWFYPPPRHSSSAHLHLLRSRQTHSPLNLRNTALLVHIGKGRVPALFILFGVLHDGTAALVQTHQQSRLIIENAVDLFESPSRSFDAKEVRDRDEQETYDGPDPEEVAADVTQANRCNHHNDELQSWSA